MRQDAFSLGIRPQNFFPKKSFGQNFLVNPLYQRKIIDACALDSEDTILEIGPGQGALTQHIISKVKRVIAIEKDKSLVNFLRNKWDAKNLEIIDSDVLEYSFDNLPDGPIKIIGNLPYNVATPIIEKVFKHRHKFSSFYMTVQLEYGKRMAATPHSKEYSSFSCFIQNYSNPKVLFRIVNTAFHPAPKVQSCFLKLDILESPVSQGEDEEWLFQIIRTAFQQRRKTLENALSKIIDKALLQKACQELNIKASSRPENLSLENFIALSRVFKKEIK